MNSSVSFFYFLSFLTVLSAVMVVISKNPIHSVLYLILTFFTLSGHYILLNAQFLAAVNIIVYAGAIMVLFLFVILFGAYRKTLIPTYDPNQFDSQIGMIENLGKMLFRDYLLPFELASVLLLVAMVGAVMLGKREIGERHF